MGFEHRCVVPPDVPSIMPERNSQSSRCDIRRPICPQTPSVLTNMPVAIEQQVEWVEHVNEVVNMTLMTGANSWYMSANIPGKPRAFLPYLGPEGVGGYRKKCNEIAANGYEGFAVS